MSPATIVVHFHAKPGKEDELRQALMPAIPRLTELPGCRGGSLFYDIDEPDLFVLIEHWDSVDAHRVYVERIESDGTMDHIRALLSRPPQRKYLTKTE